MICEEPYRIAPSPATELLLTQVPVEVRSAWYAVGVGVGLGVGLGDGVGVGAGVGVGLEVGVVEPELGSDELPAVFEPLLEVEEDINDELEVFPAAAPQPVMPRLARKSAPSVQGMLRKKRKIQPPLPVGSRREA